MLTELPAQNGKSNTPTATACGYKPMIIGLPEKGMRRNTSHTECSVFHILEINYMRGFSHFAASATHSVKKLAFVVPTAMLIGVPMLSL
jgi:hypothetical protein